ncbi:GAF domain-containing protein [Actinoplanes sp. NPDC024001]|uniref:GAF domain-containing protein n=1 Tax=Actinoplanes sp. NPDC024001 TaxID=3154598 RepID=UPI0033F480FA
MSRRYALRPGETDNMMVTMQQYIIASTGDGGERDAGLQPWSSVAASSPLHSVQRLAAASRFAGAGAALAADFHTLAKAVAGALEVKAVAVNLVLSARVWIVGSYGLPSRLAKAGSLPTAWAPCTRVVLQNGTVVFEDLRDAYRGQANPVVSEHGMRFYIGVPLRFRSDVIGTLCVLDDRPAALSAEAVTVLAAIGDEVMRALLEQEPHGEGAIDVLGATPPH